MNDPSVNVIIFESEINGAPIHHVKEGMATADDGIKRAWLAAKQEHGLHEATMRRVYADWEPSDEDKIFLTNAFPHDTTIEYAFNRPPAHARSIQSGPTNNPSAVDHYKYSIGSSTRQRSRFRQIILSSCPPSCQIQS
jgi:hypothetical protein